MHVILPGYAIPLKGLFCVVFHCFVLQISVGYLAVCYIVLDCFSIPGSSSPVSRTIRTKKSPASEFVRNDGLTFLSNENPASSGGSGKHIALGNPSNPYPVTKETNVD